MPVAEEVAPESSVLLHVTDHRLDGGAAPELALDAGGKPALLAGAEHAHGFVVVMAAVALVDEGARAPGR